MEIFRENIRQIVLKQKSNEEKNKKDKEKFANVLRLQIHTIAKTSVKQILRQLKETDEENKSIRTSLREILVKFHELKFVNKVKPEEIPVVDKLRESSRDLSQISNIQRSHHVGGQIHNIPSKCESNIRVREIRANNLGDLASTITTTSNAKLTIRKKSVNFENILIKKFRKLKGEILIIRLGNGREKQEKNLLFGEGDGLEENLTTAINTLFPFLHILPEWEKIKCKIKNRNFASDQPIEPTNGFSKGVYHDKIILNHKIKKLNL